jgi:hypothetical protein
MGFGNGGIRPTLMQDVLRAAHHSCVSEALFGARCAAVGSSLNQWMESRNVG